MIDPADRLNVVFTDKTFAPLALSQLQIESLEAGFLVKQPMTDRRSRLFH